MIQQAQYMRAPCICILLVRYIDMDVSKIEKLVGRFDVDIKKKRARREAQKPFIISFY